MAHQFVKNGSGTLTLQANNAASFSGNVQTNAGTLEFGTGDVLSDSTTVELAAGATLLVTLSENIGGLIGGGEAVIAAGQKLEVGFNNADSGFSGDISGAGRFAKSGTGVYTVSGNLTYGGATQINAGTLRRSGGSGVPDTTDLHVAAGAVYDLNNSSDTIDALTGEGSVTMGTALAPKTLTLGSDNGSGDFSGAISGTFGHLTKVGLGLQGLSGTNTYSGTTSFNGGILSTDSSANLGSGGLVFNGGRWGVGASFSNSRPISIGIGSSGTIEVSRGRTLTQAGAISGTLATLNLRDEGTLLLTASATPKNMNIDRGVLRFSGGGSLSAGTNVTVAMGGSWDLNGVSDHVATIAGAGEIQLTDLAQLTIGATASDTTFSGVISGTGSLVKNGHPQLTLSGANTYSGGTAVNLGTLAISSNANLGDASSPLSFDGGTLQTTGSFSMTRNVTLNANGGTIEVAPGGNLAVDGALDGAGVVTKTGRGTLSLNGDAAAYTGPIDVNDGILLVNGNASSAPVTISADGTLGGDGAVGSVVNGGRVSPGNSPATLNVFGDFTQHAEGVLVMQLAGEDGPGVDYDHLAVRGGGAASLDGTLEVSLLKDFSPKERDTFEILTAAGGVTGTFANENLPSLSSGLSWNVVYGASSVLLEVAAAGLAGDYNANGLVDAADYVVWRVNLGSGTALPNDDTTGVGPDDYNRWKANFGQTAGAGSSTLDMSAVPEPAAGVLLILAAVGWHLLRRRSI